MIEIDEEMKTRIYLRKGKHDSTGCCKYITTRAFRKTVQQKPQTHFSY